MDVFEAVADPTRRTLLAMLARNARAAGELVSACPGLTQPAVSRHLRVLREVGLVDVHAQAQRRIYALRPQGLSQLDQWLANCRAGWTSHLDALEKQLTEDHLKEKHLKENHPKEKHLKEVDADQS